MKFNGILSKGYTDTWNVAPDVIGLRTMFVNVAFIGKPDADWVLVDTGLSAYTDSIIEIATQHFKKPPVAMILTHGHFDHIGGVKKLIQEWNVPVYAHPLELPFLTGKEDYPPADPAVGGGLMSMISPLFSHHGIDLGSAIHPLPEDRSVPGAKGWEWIHTPGHSPGHIALFRPEDHVLIAGDALLTVKQESVFAVATQHQVVHGPPSYFTTDWEGAEKSVRTLALLNPHTVLSGHGVPMQGEELSTQLAHLCKNFKEIALPEQGKYV